MEITFTKRNQEELEKNLEEAMKNPKFQNLVKHLGWSKEEVLSRTTKLQDTLDELQNCADCKGLYMCKNLYAGHVSMPKKEEGRIYFTYAPCKYKKREVEQKKAHLSEQDICKMARMKDIDVKDKKRMQVIKWLDQFFEEYDFSKNMKGLYLHGNFGCGKTFLVSALLHELEEKKNVGVELVYFPEILRELKSDWEMYEHSMKRYCTVDILCIDDIGAEKVSEWSRDEVLGTILQTRMNHNLTTFFTSNLTKQELENHFIMNEKADEKIKARRIMERINQLTEDMELLSENRRK